MRALKFILSKRYRDSIGAAQWDYALDNPDKVPGFWEAHDEYMQATQPQAGPWL